MSKNADNKQGVGYVPIRFDCKHRYEISLKDENDKLRQYFVLNDDHYVLAYSGAVYRFLAQSDSAEQKVDALELGLHSAVEPNIMYIGGVSKDLYLLDSLRCVYRLEHNEIRRFGHVINDEDIAGFYVADRIKEGARFFFIEKRPSYFWYKSRDLSDRTPRDSRPKCFYKRNFLGENGNDTLIHSAQQNGLIMFLTCNPSETRTYAVIIDIINEKKVHCLPLSHFKIQRGVIIDQGSYVFLTAENELLYIYHISQILQKEEANINEITGGEWEQHKIRYGLPEKCDVFSAYAYGQLLKDFIKYRNLTQYEGLLRKLKAVLDSNENFGSFSYRLQELHEDFESDELSACEIYCKDSLYVIASDNSVYEFSISF